MNDTLLLYTQDHLNKTYISECMPSHELLNVSCKLSKIKELGGQITNWDTSMVRDPVSQDIHHVLAFTTEQYYNTIFLEDLTTNLPVDSVILGSGFPGNISSATITG